MRMLSLGSIPHGRTTSAERKDIPCVHHLIASADGKNGHTYTRALTFTWKLRTDQALNHDIRLSTKLVHTQNVQSTVLVLYVCI